MATHTRDIYLTANGIRHHVIARGDQGRPIVMMIHGLTQQAHVFDGVADWLAEHYHVYALDVRGRGESDHGPADGYHFANYVDDLEEVRDGLGIAEFALVGTSMGGLIAMHYGARHPERVSRIVLNDIGPEMDREGLRRVLAAASSTREAFPDLNAVARFYQQEHPAILANRNEDEIIEYVRWHVRRNDLGVYVWKMDPEIRANHKPSVPQPDAWADFAALTCPILVVRGATSDILTREIVAKMHEVQPGIHTTEVPIVGHAPSLVEREALEAIRDFLAG